VHEDGPCRRRRLKGRNQVSQEFLIEEVGATREWANKDGHRFLAYDLKLEGEPERVEWSRKPDSDPPKPGEKTPLANIQNGPHGKRLRVDWDAMKEHKAGSGSPRRSKGSDWTPEAQRDPERSARILRQHSQEMAIRLVASNPDFPSLENDAQGTTQLSERLKALVDAFDADVNQAGQAAIQGAGGASPSSLPREGSPGVSPAASAPDSPPVSMEEAEQALDTAAALEASKRRKVAEFVVTQLAPARAVKAVKNLTNTSDLGERAATVKALIENTEAWIGGPLPAEEKTDDSIPF
jgi:hypothetical protein